MRELICTICGKSYMPGITGEDNYMYCSHRCICKKGGCVAHGVVLPIPVDVARLIEHKTYNGEIVVSFKDIDKVHGKADGTAGRFFRLHRDHFNKDKDYFIAKPNDIKSGALVFQSGTSFRSENEIEKYENRTFEINNNGTILLTAQGYAMITKPYNDALAWQVQRALVNRYFESEDELINLLPTTAEGELLKSNLLLAKTTALATGEDATKAMYKAVITTEKTIGKPLKVIKEYWAGKAGIKTRGKKLSD